MRASLLSIGIVGIVAIVVACGAPPARPVDPKPAPTVTPVAPAVAAPDPFAALNLGFETTDGDAPAGWSKPAAEYELHTATDAVHGGARSLRVRAIGAGKLGATAAVLAASPYLGKRLRVRGWIKTADAAGGAALWLRVDGGDGDLDNMMERKITGTAAWTEASVEVAVGPGAEKIVVGAMLIGGGTAWFDDLRIEVLEPAGPPQPIVLEGTVTDTAGAAIAGAIVTLISAQLDIATHVQSDAGGRFRFDAKVGRWGVSAHAPARVGAFLAQTDYAADTRTLRIALPASGGVTVRGRTTQKPIAATYLQISPLSDHDADLFTVPVAADGSFSAVLPRGDDYHVAVISGVATESKKFTRKGDVVDVVLPMTVFAPPSPEVVAHIAATAIPLATAEAGHGFDDMAPLAKLVGNARIVALGEATHGTREFFQLKHRFLEYLVEKHGFSLFVIEANQPECRAINDYVLTGKGTARAALDGIYFWTWNTEEVLAMIEWMRAWNADPKHTTKVQFAGNDMQTSPVAHASVAAYLKRVAPARADALLAPIATLARGDSAELVAKLDAAAQTQLTAALAAIAKAFDADRKTWTAATSPREFADARHDLTILQQAARMYAADAGEGRRAGFDARDQAMADNLAWLLEQNPRARAVLWAHNGHISNTLQTFTNMGSLLHKRFGAAYLNLGFVFGEGAFQALDFTTGKPKGLKEFKLGPPPDIHASVAFARTGKPLLVLDLRTLPKQGPVRAWFAAPHPVRDTGSGFSNERNMTYPVVLPDLYDAVIYVDKTTRARPLAAR